MDKLLVTGNNKLSGEVNVHGAKNSALPILASTVLIKGECIIHNCPKLKDVDVTLSILKNLGAVVLRESDTVIVDTSNLNSTIIPDEMMREMRSSIIFLGSLLSRFKEATLCFPGGCDIGLRPVDLHLSSLRSLGATIEENGSEIVCTAKNGLRGAKIVLPFPSVGATENVIISCVMAKGVTTLVNAAREPEILDLIDFLNKAGAKIDAKGEGTIIIEGVKSLYSTEHCVIPDRIVASTYLSASSITSSTLVINNIKPSHLTPVFPIYMSMGAKLYLEKDRVKIVPPQRLKSVKNIKTMPYPGFPTDSGPIVVAPLTIAHGTSVIIENIFENRFRYVSELSRFGADISITDKTAIISGKKELHPANVKCTDLRGGAALLIAALCADGTSSITDLYHIDRGYEDICENLNNVGANIKRINDEKGK